MIFEDWGLINYDQALKKQLAYLEKLDSDLSENKEHPGFLIFCSHPEVVTTGRQTKPEDIFAWQGNIIDIQRGGRATYHGPSQLVIYPIINLKKSRHHRGPQEIRGYLRDFEKAIVLSLNEIGVANAQGKTRQKILDQTTGQDIENDETGVWVEDKKVASLGIAVKKWITYHGAAINFYHDPKAFLGINPCGFKSETMISVEKILGHTVDIEIFKKILLRFLIKLI